MLDFQWLNQEHSGAPVLEISPWHNVRFVGDNVEYFDVMDRESLIEKAQGDPNLAELLDSRKDIPFYGFPYVHHVNQFGDLSQIDKKYNLVFSSHVVEHTLCLVRHLNQVYDLLNDNCYYILAIPDKRYCFDHYIPPSTLGNVLEDFHLRKGKEYSLKTMIHANLYTTHNDPAKHWRGDHGNIPLYSTPDIRIEDFLGSPEGFDFHNYQFTPSSFEEVVTSLKKYNYINFDVNEIKPTVTNSHEFSAVLKKV
jgi:hypothetical protein